MRSAKRVRGEADGIGGSANSGENQRVRKNQRVRENKPFGGFVKYPAGLKIVAGPNEKQNSKRKTKSKNLNANKKRRKERKGKSSELILGGFLRIDLKRRTKARGAFSRDRKMAKGFRLVKLAPKRQVE